MIKQPPILSARVIVVAMIEVQRMCDVANKVKRNGHGESPAQYLLRRGQQFSERIPSRWTGLPMDCYRNAFKMASRSRGKLRYVEGEATSFFPTEHAWCIDADNRVIDPTWEDHATVDYFGIVMTLDQVREARRIRRHYSSVLWGMYRVDHWKRVREILEGR